MKTVNCKRWTADEREILVNMPCESKSDIRQGIIKLAKEWKLSYNKVYQQWYKLHNGLFKRDGAKEPMEWEKLPPKRKTRSKGLKTPKNAPKTTRVSVALRKAEKSVSLNPRVRLTPTTVVIQGFKRISVKNKNIKITY